MLLPPHPKGRLCAEDKQMLLATIHEVQEGLARLEEMVRDDEQPCPDILRQLADIRSLFGRITEHLLLSGLKRDLLRSSLAGDRDEPIHVLRTWHELMGRYLW